VFCQRRLPGRAARLRREAAAALPRALNWSIGFIGAVLIRTLGFQTRVRTH
jgi:hypothetical protein